MEPFPIHWVTDDTALAAACQVWSSQPVLAVDTEFMRTDTYYPKPALIQVFDGERSTLIDPTTISDWQPLAGLLADENVLKVLHACSEDIEVFERLLGVSPWPLLDTQVAAAFCGLGYSKGYASLVELLLSVSLPKEETRSDWLQRPLTDAQTHYAANDVTYLYQLYERLRDTLEDNGRLPWVMSECHAIVKQVQMMQSPREAHKRFKGAWRLAPRNLAVLIRLAHWREATAQQRNVPRNRIVDNKAVTAIAEVLPTHMAQLRQFETLRDGAIRRYGSAILMEVKAAMDMDDALLPSEMVRPPKGDALKWVKQLRANVELLAERMGLAPELIATRRDLEFLAQCDDNTPLPEHLQGWRKPLLETILNTQHE